MMMLVHIVCKISVHLCGGHCMLKSKCPCGRTRRRSSGRMIASTVTRRCPDTFVVSRVTAVACGPLENSAATTYAACACSNPRGYLRTLVPNTIQSRVFGARNLKYWVLGPSGKHTTGFTYKATRQSKA